jgi:GNAT superfamily N-acetyltransferase
MAAEIVIRPATGIPFDEFLTAFNAGYEGYIIPLRLNAEQFSDHLQNHDIDLQASQAAEADGRLVGTALLGRRGERGWVGGVGVSLDYRQQGIGRRLMAALAEAARSSGITVLMLEVIVGNDSAYHLYQKLGYQTLRKLHFLSRTAAPLEAESGGIVVREVPVEEALQHYPRLHPTPVPWQRAPESLLKQSNRLTGWTALENGRVTGYAVTGKQTQTIRWMDIAAENDRALNGLIAHLHGLHPEANAQAVNVGEDDPAYKALTAAGYTEAISQWEMALRL